MYVCMYVCVCVQYVSDHTTLHTQEYESTISSLRTQVSILHQKTEVLQKEIDRRQASRTQDPMANLTVHNS